jgi:hypothetical protein
LKKQLWKQAAHTRIVPTKFGYKKISINPLLRKPVLQTYRPRNISRTISKPLIMRPMPYAAKKEPNSQTQPPKLKPRQFQPEEAKSDGLEDWAEQTAAAMTFPTIAFKGAESWFPDNLRARLVADRLAQILKTQKGINNEPFKEFATDSEALGYISTMSMTAPLDSEMAEIMQYLFNKVVGSQNVPSDLKKDSLPENQMNLLKRLKRDIRKSQWEAIKNRKKEGDNNEQTAKEV